MHVIFVVVRLKTFIDFRNETTVPPIDGTKLYVNNFYMPCDSRKNLVLFEKIVVGPVLEWNLEIKFDRIKS